MIILDNDYWSNRYLNRQTGWDTGAVTAPLKTYFDQLTDKNISILIPGCGNSYEAEYLLQLGFYNITLIDIAAVLCENLEKKLAVYMPLGLKIICGDFFEMQGQFDLIVEQTFFCALDPALRNDYAVKMQHLLKPGGKLVGLLFNTLFQGGPPFGGDREEYRTLFDPFFRIDIMSPCYNSIPPRAGTELFIKMTRKD